MAKRCYTWLEANYPNPRVVRYNKLKARAQVVAVTLFPKRDGGYAVGHNARGPGLSTARAEIQRDAPALRAAIGGSINNNQIYAETLS